MLNQMKALSLAVVFFLAVSTLVWAAEKASVTETDMRAAILGTQTFTAQQIAAMDLNNDGKVDVADLIRIRLGVDQSATLLGDHIGVMYRDGGKIIDKATGVSGGIPLRLTITSETPSLAGVIDNGSATVANPAGAHFSLYFPKGQHSVTFQSVTGHDMRFVVKCQSIAPALVGGDKVKLDRTITFTGDFKDPVKRNVLAGTYQDDIKGIEGSGTITLTGQFQISFEAEG